MLVLRIVATLLLIVAASLVLLSPLMLMAVIKYGLSPYLELGLGLYVVSLLLLLRKNNVRALVRMARGQTD